MCPILIVRRVEKIGNSERADRVYAGSGVMRACTIVLLVMTHSTSEKLTSVCPWSKYQSRVARDTVPVLWIRHR